MLTIHTSIASWSHLTCLH